MFSVPTDQLREGVLVEFSLGGSGLSLYVDGELVQQAFAPNSTNPLTSNSKPLVFGWPHRDYTGDVEVDLTVYELSIWHQLRDDIVKGEFRLLSCTRISTVRLLEVGYVFSPAHFHHEIVQGELCLSCAVRGDFRLLSSIFPS